MAASVPRECWTLDLLTCFDGDGSGTRSTESYPTAAGSPLAHRARRGCRRFLQLLRSCQPLHHSARTTLPSGRNPPAEAHSPARELTMTRGYAPGASTCDTRFVRSMPCYPPSDLHSLHVPACSSSYGAPSFVPGVPATTPKRDGQARRECGRLPSERRERVACVAWPARAPTRMEQAALAGLWCPCVAVAVPRGDSLQRSLPDPGEHSDGRGVGREVPGGRGEVGTGMQPPRGGSDIGGRPGAMIPGWGCSLTPASLQ